MFFLFIFSRLAPAPPLLSLREKHLGSEVSREHLVYTAVFYRIHLLERKLSFPERIPHSRETSHARHLAEALLAFRHLRELLHHL